MYAQVVNTLTIIKNISIIKVVNVSLIKTCSLFGHRRIWNQSEVKEKLRVEIEKQIQNGFNRFLVGTHGDFDSIALSVLRDLRRIYQDIKIIVVFTSLYPFQKDKFGFSISQLYEDVETLTYPIEDEYFKRQIIMNNRYMINDSDLVICYVDTKSYQSGAKLAMKYAIKQQKVLVNVFDSC